MHRDWLQRGLLLLVVQVFIAVSSIAAHGLETVAIPENIGALDLSAALEHREGNNGRVQLSTSPDAEGIVRRIEVQATEVGTDPNWALIALTNPHDVQLERLLVAPNFSLPGSGILSPDLGGEHVRIITPSQGFRPSRIEDREADVFAITVDPGATVTLIFELTGENIPELYLWEPSEYRDYVSSFTLFRGTLLGVSSLLAVFLTIMFVVKGRGIFPAVAAFSWSVLFYLLVDFGMLIQLFELSAAQVRTTRAAAEAALATTLFGYLFIYLNLHRWHLRFVHLALAIGIALAILMGLAFFQPVLAIGIARAILAVVAGFGIIVVSFLALRGYDRAIMIVPTWVITVAWVSFLFLVLSGRVDNDIAQSAVAGGLVLIVMLLGFTAIQHAFTDGEISVSHVGEVERQALALNGSGDFVFDWQVERDRVAVSEGFALRLGEPHADLQGAIKRWLDRLHPEDRDRFRTGLDTLVELKRGKISNDFRILSHDGGYRTFRLRVKPVVASNGDVSRCVGTLQDVTDDRNARDRLMHDAVHDSLSGLPNRELLLDRLERALWRSREEKENKPAVFLIDLDGFANLDERIGHIASDSVLLAISRRLSRLMRPLDTIARLNGDQFGVVLVSEQSATRIAGFAEQMRKSIREPIKFGEDELSISASIGVTIYDNKQTNADTILRNAELAMMHAKRMGGDRIEAYRANTTELGNNDSDLNQDLERAIDQRELIMYFQPIYDLSNNTLAGAEALMRWNHPKRGAISPTEFIPLAERSGLIERLGKVVIEQTAIQLRTWMKAADLPEDFFVSLNLSAQQLANDNLLNDMRALITTHGELVDKMLLEVTESQVMMSPEHSAYVLETLKGMGFRLALDDFGTGHSSLSYLHRFPFDFVKIPSTFVQMEESHGISHTQVPIMRSIVTLAKDLDLKVIAEGAETEPELDRLRKLECRYAQGYAFSKPVTGPEMALILKKNAKLAQVVEMT